jgi:hypothetical protein
MKMPEMSRTDKRCRLTSRCAISRRHDAVGVSDRVAGAALEARSKWISARRNTWW